MTAKYILIRNRDVYYTDNDVNVMTLDQWKQEILKWNCGENDNKFDVKEYDYDDEVFSVDIDQFCQMLTDIMYGDQERVYCLNPSMCEMGDDYTELKLIKIQE